MEIKVLEKRILELDREIKNILEISSIDLGNIEYDNDQEEELYKKLHDIVGHPAYIHFILNR